MKLKKFFFPGNQTIKSRTQQIFFIFSNACGKYPAPSRETLLIKKIICLLKPLSVPDKGKEAQIISTCQNAG
jgi:hypothetical protein